MVSKADVKSNKTMTEDAPESANMIMSLETLSNVVSVE